jgi:hypothetical protein
MMKKKTLCLIGTSFVVGAIIALAGRSLLSGLSGFQERHGSVFVACESDRLHVLARRLSEYANQNEGRLPEPSVIPSLVAERDSLLTCAGSGQPFHLNRRMGEFSVNDEESHLLVWCPLGSHDNYAAAILVEVRNIRSKVLTVDELGGWLEREAAD